MSLHNLICQFTAGRAERQSSEEEAEVHQGSCDELNRVPLRG